VSSTVAGTVRAMKSEWWWPTDTREDVFLPRAIELIRLRMQMHGAGDDDRALQNLFPIVQEAIASGQLLTIIRTVDANQRIYTSGNQELWKKETSSLETLTSGLCKDPSGRSYLVFVWRFALDRFLKDIRGVVQRYLISDERRASGSEMPSIPTPKVSSRGRKRKWDWESAKQFCWEILEHHGEPDPNDPDLPNQAALERRVQEYFANHNGGDAPVESQIRDYVGDWLDEYSEAKKQGQ
jgi:hypothetical protein